MKKRTITLLIILLFSNLIYSQTDFEDDIQDVNAPVAPIDGWVYVILIAGICYGYKKIIINPNTKLVDRENA